MLLKYWQPLLAFVLTAVIAFSLHSWDVDRINAKHKLALKDAVEAATKAANDECAKDKQITTEVSNEYQNKIANLTVQLNRIKRLYNSSKCVPITRPTERRDAAPSEGKPAGQSGVSSGWIVDIAGEGEQYRLQLLACQDFITKTWAAKTAQ